jgi:hypothetical protein
MTASAVTGRSGRDASNGRCASRTGYSMATDGVEHSADRFGVARTGGSDPQLIFSSKDRGPDS